MTFYVDPAFFIFLLIAAIPAAVLGFCEKPLKHYGFVVSIIFLAFLFSKNVLSGLYLVGYVVLSAAVTLWYLRSCTAGKSGGWRYGLSFFATIAPLVIYKVSAAFGGDLFGFLGISYISFKTVQVIVEMHDGLIKKLNLFDYLYFLLLFAPFTSGPIMRSRDFDESIGKVMPRAEYRDLLARGLQQFVIGAFYTFVLASLFSTSIWALPKAIGSSTMLHLVIGQIAQAYGYGFYLFFDFAGYSLMAMGAGAAFGIRVPRNFNAPFISIDILEFWNRWHMTLSFFFRDFVFMRLARFIRKRKLIKSRNATQYVAFIVNMALMGCWHGLTLNYVAYGLYHGVLLALWTAIHKTSFFKKNKDKGAYKIGSWFVTLNLVMLGFALFSGQIAIG